MYYYNFSELIDKKIENIYLNDGYDILVFECYDKELVIYQCLGECCSTSYICNITNIKALLSETVISIDDKKPSNTETNDYGETDTHFYTIVTNKGFIDIDLRVEHNGYYSGWLEYNPNLIVDLNHFKKITEDIQC